MLNSKSSTRLIYSTESGRHCPGCSQPVAQCQCAANKRALAIASNAAAARDGVIRVLRETKGRGGKSVTLVRGLALDSVVLAALAKSLKAACGSGGTVKEGVIEIQGDHTVAVMAALVKLGYAVKCSGGFGG